MKKTLTIAAIILLTYSTAAAMGGRPKNINIFGSDDHQRSHNYTMQAPLSNPPVSPVPEPATFFMLGAGLIGIAAWARKR